MSVLSKLDANTIKNGAVVGSVAGFIIYMYATQLRRKSSVPLQSRDGQPGRGKSLNARFLKRFFDVLRVLVPKVWSAETAYLLMVAFALVARTYCDVWMIQNGTAIESAIIGRDSSLFKTHLFKFIYAMPFISLINNMLKLGLSELKLHFRCNLTQHLYKKYLSGFTFYQMNNLDNRIANADQLLTQDVEKFCDAVAELYSNLSKPFLDITLYAFQLAKSIGPHAPALMLLYLIGTGSVLTRLRRPVAKMTVIEQQLEGQFRFVNSRLITNSEEIAFYQGNQRERRTIMGTFDKLVQHLRDFIKFRFAMGYVDNIVAKYIATVVGYFVVSRPFFNPSYARFVGSSHSDLLKDYYESGRMLLRMAEALGRIALAGREMTRLAGFTARVSQLDHVLDDLNHGQYKRTMVSDRSSVLNSNGSNQQLVPGAGELIVKDHIIKFEKVPLVTPNGDVLITELTFEVRSGMNVLVCGPNGCGKSSLFRILGELWPLFGGRLTKPESGKLFYIPQRPYMTIGTLRDQVIYPDTQECMVRKGVADKELEKFLSVIELSYILEREGGWDAQQDWMDVLSGGEKQRIAMARLFYHHPQFAILDECTSAVSVDVEYKMYQHCRQVGITLFTVSHRKSLWKHHEYYLHMDGRGNFEFKPITDDTEEFGS